MIRRTRTPRPRSTSLRPFWERMEARQVLSAMVSVDTGVLPLLTRSPTLVHVTFGAPVADYSVGTTDLILDRVGPDGSLTPAFDDDNAPLEQLDDDGNGLTLLLPAPLDPGSYRIVLSGSGALTDADGNPLSPVDGNDLPIGDFTVERPGVTLAQATDLGPIGPSLAPEHAPIPGSLDLAADPSAVDLYKFTLPPGPGRRVGIEVDAQRQGSTLNSALTLFDSQGRTIATADLGRPDALADPYLFQGLKAGTYYLGVSGAGNLGGPGGYDVVGGVAGDAPSQAGGAYTLRIVADASDPAQVVDFQVDHADPLDPTPTGLSLRFSAALDLGTSGSGVFSQASGGIQVVDASGKAWPVAAVNYDEGHGAIGYLFRDRLPQGVYSVRLDPSRPLTDLAGVPPVSPDLPRGVLATFAVAPDTRARGADGTLAIPASEIGEGDTGATTTTVASTEDLGPLTPDVVLGGISRSLTLQPGQAAVFRFVNLYSDFYQITVRHSGGSLAVATSGDDASEGGSIDPGPDDRDNSSLTEMSTGVYLFRFTATGDAPTTITWKVSIGSFGWDSVLANGVGQGPALNLRLLSSDSPTSFPLGDPARSPGTAAAATPATGPVAGPLAATVAGLISVQVPPAAGEAGRGGVPAPSAAIITPLPSPLTFAIGGNPVGRPSLDGDHVAAVGPSSASGALALAPGHPLGEGESIDSPGLLLGGFAPSGGDPVTPAPRQASPLADGGIADPAAPPAEAPRVAMLPGEATAAPESIPPAPGLEANAEPADPGNPSDPGAAAASLGLAPSAPSSDEEAEASASVRPWAMAMVGLGAVALASFLAYRRRKATRPLPQRNPRGRIPAPHVARSRVMSR